LNVHPAAVIRDATFLSFVLVPEPPSANAPMTTTSATMPDPPAM